MNTFPERWENHFQKNSKLVSLILTSFFKLHLQISFQIFKHQISKFEQSNKTYITSEKKGSLSI